MSMFGNLSANQINAGMGLGPGGVGDQSQALFNNLYGPQGFGGQTAQYAAQGAAYGRDTGGFGGYGGMNDPFSPVGGYNAIDQNDPANIALYYKLMGIPQPGGGGGGYTPQMPPFEAPQPQAQPQVDWNAAFNQITAPQSPYSTNSGGLATLPGGGVDPNDPGNIAAYWAIMGGHGGGGGIPASAPSPGYTPDATATQNGFYYPGGGSMGLMFDPNKPWLVKMGVPAQKPVAAVLRIMRTAALTRAIPATSPCTIKSCGAAVAHR